MLEKWHFVSCILGILYGEILFDIQLLNNKRIFSKNLMQDVFLPIFSFYNLFAPFYHL